MQPREERTPAQVSEVIRTAKLQERELCALSQVLRFADEPASECLSLMQLDATLLAEMEAGRMLVFKGEGNENVVLCTESRTYDVKETETSNSLLLLPDLTFSPEVSKDTSNNSIESDTSLENLNKSAESEEAEKPPRQIAEKEIAKTFFTYYELRQCKPRLKKILQLLEATRYRGKEHEYSVEKSLLYDYATLFDKVQASDGELRQALKDFQAFEIDGYYRLLEFDYEFRVLSYMLDLIDENSWELDRISREVTMESLKELAPGEILEGMFDCYAEVSMVEDGVTYYRYKEEKVCRFLARVLLKSAGKFSLEEFLQAWRDSVPEGMQVQEKMLSGIALTDTSSVPPVVWGFAESDLPEDISERFTMLFHTKPKWTLEQITPFIQCYASEKVNVNALVTKYARASTQDGVRVFSAKHSK